jgi:hypothetical protein
MLSLVKHRYFSTVACVVLYLCRLISIAQDVPNLDFEPLGTVPDDAEVINPIIYPSAITGLTSVSLTTPSFSTNFQALTNAFSITPPDTQGAIGPNHVVTMLNTQVRIQDRSGTHISTVSLFDWWTNKGNILHIYDPRIVYDPYAQRWIATACTEAAPTLNTNAHLLFAVSQSSNPTGNWNFHRIKVDANNQNWLDFPYIGFNQKWIAVSANLVSPSGAFVSSRIYLFNRTNVYAGGTNFSILARTDYPFIAPALTYSPFDTTPLYCLTVSNSDEVRGGVHHGNLRQYSITGSPDSPSIEVSSPPIESNPWAWTAASVNSAPQTNSSIKIWTSNARLQAVFYRDLDLFAVHTVHLPYNAPTRSAIQWWQISPMDGIVWKCERIMGATTDEHLAFPSIAVNKYFEILIGFSIFSSNKFPSAGYAFRSRADQTDSFRPYVTLRPGEGIFYNTDSSGRNRWGDYSSTVVDPVNDTDFWTLQEYSLPSNGDPLVNSHGQWATWWGRIELPVPTNDIFANPTTVSGSEGRTTNSVFRATWETGEPTHANYTNLATVWFSWTAPTNGPVSFDTYESPSDADTILAAYTGSAVDALTRIAQNDDAQSNYLSRVSFTASSGTTYRIVMARKWSFSETLPPLILHWLQPSAPLFVLSPTNQNVVAGESFTLLSTPIGAPTPSLQWRLGTNAISGEIYSSYTNGNANMTNAGSYSIVASNSYGMATSSVAIVTMYTNGTATYHPDTVTLISNYFNVHISGVTNHAYVVQGTTNYVDWVPVHTNNASFNFSNLVSTNLSLRVFRVLY